MSRPIRGRSQASGRHRVLAEFLSALHQPAPADAPANPTRGIPLAASKETDDWFQVIADHANAETAREVWQKAVAAPAWQGAPLWLHGDLHPVNVIVRDGRLAGVIDFGELKSYWQVLVGPGLLRS